MPLPAHPDTHSYTLVAVEAERQCRQVFVCLFMTDIGICFQAQNQTTYFLQAFLIVDIISDSYYHYFLTVNKKLLSNSLVETLQNISKIQLFFFLFFLEYWFPSVFCFSPRMLFFVTIGRKWQVLLHVRAKQVCTQVIWVIFNSDKPTERGTYIDNTGSIMLS